MGHKLTFGYGHLTSKWTRGVRSYIYPMCITGLYRLLSGLGLDLVLAPCILRAILSAISDYCFFRWSNNSKWSIFLIASSWFWFYAASRTLLNTLETCCWNYCIYPRYYAYKHGFLWIVLCFIRPTAAILWLPLCICHIYNSIHSTFKLLLSDICWLVRWWALVLLLSALIRTPNFN